MILALVFVLVLAALVGTVCYLAINGNTDRIEPLLAPLQPYILPPLGAVVGYAFGHQIAHDDAHSD